jgi:RNA polymerase sigma factor (sigma-70 family)
MMIADVDQLYRGFSVALERIVRRDVTAPTVVIEDACQTAWARLLRHARRVEEDSVKRWLATTAVHEAIKLARRDQRELSLEAQLEATGEPNLAGVAAGPYEHAEWRERLALVGQLPERQRQLLWMQCVGLSYDEIAAEAGLTLRTVERQVLRGRKRLRAAA